MVHAKRIAGALYPGAACHEAQSSRRCVGPGRFVNSREDLFGIADLTLLFRGSVVFWQVTSEGGATERRARLRTWWEQHRDHIPACAELWTVAWRPRKYMLRWRWSPVEEKWIRERPVNTRGEEIAP